MPDRLMDLDALEVSLVPKAANRKKFLLLKSLKGGKKEVKDVIKKTLAEELEHGKEIDNILKQFEMEDDEKEMWKALAKIIQAMGNLDTDLLGKILAKQRGIGEEIDFNPDLSSDAEKAVVGAIRILQEYADEIPGEVIENLINLLGGMETVDEIMGEEEFSKMFNRPPYGIPYGRRYGYPGLSQEARMILEEVLQKLEAVEEEMPEEVMKALKEMGERKTAAFDEIEKSLKEVPQPVKEQIKKLYQEKEEARKELEAKKEEERKQLFIQKAKDEFTNLPLKAEELGLILKGIQDNLPGDYEKIENVFKSINGLLGENSEIFKELGTSRSDDKSIGDNWTKIEKKAEVILKSEEGITKEQAVKRVLDENPALYKAYLEEKSQ